MNENKESRGRIKLLIIDDNSILRGCLFYDNIGRFSVQPFNELQFVRINYGL